MSVGNQTPHYSLSTVIMYLYLKAVEYTGGEIGVALPFYRIVSLKIAILYRSTLSGHKRFQHC